MEKQIYDRSKHKGRFRHFLKCFIPGVAGITLLCDGQPVEAKERPNIVIIIADDMGYSYIGCFGGEIDTPVIDRLAANGLKYTQFYNAARCCPTRASLLTGLYPHQAGMGHQSDDTGFPAYKGDLRENCVTVSNTPFRYYKSYLHEGGIASPLIAHWPQGIQARGEYRRQSSHIIDLMATCVDVAGAEYPKSYDGHAISPMEGQSLAASFDQNTDTERILYWEHQGNKAIRKGNWKLVALNSNRWELYDLEKDRTEMRDLSDSLPEKAQDLQTLWEVWAEKVQVVEFEKVRERRIPLYAK